MGFHSGRIERVIGGYGNLIFPAPEGGGKPKLGGELRREEQRLSRTMVYVDLDGAVDDMSEGFFSLVFPPNSGTT
jgi:hypothetical protein